MRRLLERFIPSSGQVRSTGSQPFSVDAPWIIGRDDGFRVAFTGGEPPPRKGGFLRFDIYPLHGPLHMVRHHGFWDVPAEHLRGTEFRFLFRGDDLVLRTPAGPRSFSPVWRSKIPLLGYAMVHLSTWDGRRRPPRQRAVIPGMHLFRNPGEDPPLDFAFISLTQRCNLSCSMCMRHSLEKWENADVLPAVVESLLSAAPGLHSVFLGGIGEPLLYGGLADLVGKVKSRMPTAGQVGMNTNGMLMRGRRAAALIDEGMDWICFSIDGAQKDTVEMIREGSDFDLLRRNIAATVRYRGKSGRKGPWLASNFVVREENVGEVIPFIELAASLGLDAVQISHRRDFREGEFRMLGEERLAPVFTAAKRVAKKRGVHLTLPALRPSGDFRCRFLQSVYLLLDGEAVPCCRMLPGAFPGRTESFGSAARRPLDEIWSGSRYRDFREKVHSQDPPEVCRLCPYATELLT